MISRMGSVYIDRSPDFFALNRARGDTRTIVVELEGRPVGYACYAVRDALVAGRPRRVASAHDFRVDPSMRRHKIGSKIVAELFRRVVAEGCDHLYGMLARGNDQATPFTLGGPGWPHFTSGGLLYNFTLRPRRRFPRSKYRIGPACEEDIPEIVEIFNAHYRNHNFAPIYTPETFRTMLSSCVDYDIGDLFVARHKGRILAVLGVWDQKRTKSIVLLRLHPMLSFLFALFRAVTRLLRLSMKAPRNGEPLSSLYVRHSAVREGGEEAFRDLVRWTAAYTRNRLGRMRLIFATAHERDLRLWRSSKLGRGSKFLLYYHSYRPTVSERDIEALSNHPFYDDFSLS